MASFRFAILKEIQDKIYIAQFKNKEFIEYDQDVFLARLLSEAKADIKDVNSKKNIIKRNSYTEQEIYEIITRAYNNVVNELKKDTVRAE